MNEVEKMYSNAGIKPVIRDNAIGKGYYIEHQRVEEYPPFTAEKQLEIMKAISTNHISADYSYKYLGIDRDEIDGEIYLNLCIDGEKYHAHDKDFSVALAKLVNLIWRDLTDAERTQIKEILE